MLTTFPGTHKMARCTVMRLAGGRRLGGTAPSILRRAHAHRGPTASSKNATTPLACASVQSPQAQARPRRGPERRSSIRCRSLRCEHPLPRSKRVQPECSRRRIGRSRCERCPAPSACLTGIQPSILLNRMPARGARNENEAENERFGPGAWVSKVSDPPAGPKKGYAVCAG